MYPLVCVNLTKYKENIEQMIKLTKPLNIELTVVSKMYCSKQPLIDVINESEVKYIGDANIENFIKIKTKKKKMLLRLPQLHELNTIIKYVDVTLQSELKTIEEMNRLLSKAESVHEIILMFDLGDLREGLYYNQPYLETVEKIISLKNIKLIGIGTNLTCFGGVIPDLTVLRRLENIKNEIEKTFNIKLSVISGGNSSAIEMVRKKEIPQFINHLRLGESIILGRETAYGKQIEKMHDDVITVVAQIIEIKNKPSMPDGKTGMDAFGNRVFFTDKGPMNRAILALGKQNVDCNNLIPTDDSEILGCSSDHLILNIKDQKYEIGDTITFKLTYGGILSVMTSPYTRKKYER
ncbi:MAG: alanine racemase [Acholeplasmataceae bacterium]